MSENRRPLQVALLWHFHQPDYRGPTSGAPALPWTRLHALKDYADMLARLAGHPGVRATVAITPCLLEQLRDLERDDAPADPFLETARRPVESLSQEERRFVVTYFLAFKRETLARGLPRVAELAAMRGEHGVEPVPDAVVARFDAGALRDLQVLFHLAWCGALLRGDPAVARLREKGRGFTEDDKHELLEVQARFLRGVLGRFRDAPDNVELATGPSFHPILPLLCDLETVHESSPTIPLPEGGFRHPEDARVQLEAGRATFEAILGRRPNGVWPPEGALSQTALRLVGATGWSWAASDEQVLRTAVGERRGGGGGAAARRARWLYRPWRLEGGPVLLFRDRELSELIARGYASWNPVFAADDFVRRLARVQRAIDPEAGAHTVTVALDGENAWELYPDNGAAFLEALYGALESSPELRTVTLSEAATSGEALVVDRVLAGSWLEGGLSTWVGRTTSNRAWELLELTRSAVAAARGGPRLDDAAWRHVLAAEGSDWFWWLGGERPSPFVEEFDACFREHLKAAWRAIGSNPPGEIDAPIRRIQAPPTAYPAGPVRAVVDGRATDYFEWLAAARVPTAAVVPAAGRVVTELYFGSDGTSLYLRLDPADPPAKESLGGGALRLHFPGYPDRVVGIALPETGARVGAGVRVAVDRIVEVAVPLVSVPGAEDGYRFQVEIETRGGAVQRVPDAGSLRLPPVSDEGGGTDWFV